MNDAKNSAEVAASAVARYMTAVEAAAYLRVSLSWLRRATRNLEVPHAAIGRRKVYDREDLDAYVNFKKAGGQWGR